MLIIVVFLLFLMSPFAAFAQAPAAQVKDLQTKAEEGDINAERELGYRYSSGKDVAQDYAEAAKWYRRAAEKGDSGAQVWLGRAYAYGDGVPQDDVKAVEWYYKSAKHGNVEAYHALGLAYALGKGVDKDYVKTYKWFKLAIDKGDKALDKLFDELTAQMTPEQISQGNMLVEQWLSGNNGSMAEPQSPGTQPDMHRY